MQNYLTPDFCAAYGLWARIKRHGWPHGRGWANEPAALVEMVELFDAEVELLKERDRENNAGNRRTAGGG